MGVRGSGEGGKGRQLACIKTCDWMQIQKQGNA